MENDILIIGIAGGTNSGKTTLTKHIKKRFGDRIAVLSHDNYYHRRDDMSLEERRKVNYDEPAALETDLMARHLDALRQGQAIDCPVYDFTQHNRTNRTLRVEPRQVIIVEGILIFENKTLRDMMDIMIFVDADADTRLGRRILRDVEERDRTVRSVVEQYEATVKPMHEKYVEPSRKYAHIVVPEGGENAVALDMIVNRIQRHLEAL